MKIATRIGILIGGLVVLMLGIGGLGIFGIGKSNDALKTVYEDRVVALDQLGHISYLIQRNRVLAMDMVLKPEPAHIEKRNTEFRANLVKIGKTWDAYMSTYLTPEEAVLAKDFAKARTVYEAEGLVPAADAMVAGQTQTAQTLLREKVSPLAPAMHESLQKLIQLQLDVAKQEYVKAEANAANMRAVAMVAIAVGAVLAAAFGMALVRGIARQLGCEPGEAADVVKSVASGNLGTRIVTRPGDTDSLLVQLQVMQGNLAQVVTTVRQGSEGVATASAEIAQGNHDLSARTEQQASALEETAASMEELGSTVKQNADSARQANQLALNASSVAVQGGQVVNQVVETMKGINESSRKIADIISVIDGIAFQTNILALNAAVEAARAGEQGRGFAVVASEVRSLAGRSAEAAKEITALINASVERVEHGSALVDQAGTTMAEVVDSIKRVTDIMGEISAASNEQAQGVAQVGEAVTQMDQGTQQNAALVEEMAAAASSLKGQANELVQAVAFFQLGGQQAMRAPGAVLAKVAVRSSTPPAVPFKGPERRTLAARAG